MSVTLSLEDVQRAGFPMGGEPLVAIDLVDTLMLVTDPPTDLLRSPEQAATWWSLQAGRLPDGPQPDLGATRRLRSAIRDLLDAHLEHRAPLETAVEDVNAVCAAVPTSLRLVPSTAPQPTAPQATAPQATAPQPTAPQTAGGQTAGGQTAGGQTAGGQTVGGQRVETRWHTEHGGNAALASIAREAIELVSDPQRVLRLRRCANPACSMLFLADTKRRLWCTPNICGNRTRVARHYERTHS